MKKSFIIGLVVVVIALSAFYMLSGGTKTPTDTAGKIISETTEYFDNGCSATIVVSDNTESVLHTKPETTALESAPIRRGSKSYILRNKKGKELWRFTVRGTFLINPDGSVTCTDASYTADIAKRSWKNRSASARFSEDQAIGQADFIKKLLFFTVETKSCHVTLACDSNGKLS